MLETRRVNGVLRKAVFGIDDSQSAVLFERCRIVAKLVQQYPESPDICIPPSAGGAR